MTTDLSCFKAYDIRGRMPDQLNEALAYLIGGAYAQYVKPEKVVVGHDIRLSSRGLCDALIHGLTDAGVNVFDIGLCGTEEIYFGTFFKQMDGGIMVTASHNPKDYNGLKLVREESRPISQDTGLFDIKAIIEQGVTINAAKKGTVTQCSYRAEFITHLLQYIDVGCIKPLKVVMDSGNGCASVIVDAIADKLPIEIIRMNHEPDGEFPNGIPNPLLPENRRVTAEAVRQHQADLGIAWDGDFDRCFFFDEQGNFIEGYYLVGLLASHFLKAKPGQKIIYDPRVIWNTIDIVTEFKGIPVMSKGGHAFIKDKMRQEDAVYGGEMSAHHYFRDFSYCDSGMIPWLIVLEILSRIGQPLSELVNQRITNYPSSGEINRKVANPEKLLNEIEAEMSAEANLVEHIDGLSLAFDEWRFNLRMSNTEPLIRLNVESRQDVELMKAKTEMLLKRVGGKA